MFHFPEVKTHILFVYKSWINKLYRLFKAVLIFSILVSSKNKFLGIPQWLCLMLDQVYIPKISDNDGGMDLNHRPPSYEHGELTGLLYPA